MGIFGKLFEKKVCSICGGEIGLLGNRKLEDGNMCKNCAAQLSPWFSDRRQSTVEEIKGQLAYREANRTKVKQFRTTRTLGENMKVLLDEDKGMFMVTSSRNPAEANPDVLALSDVTGCTLDIDERETEIKREVKKADGTTERISYNPPRYHYKYDFYMIINVQNPYFNEIRFKLNDTTIESDPAMNRPRTGAARLMNTGTRPEQDIHYRRYEKMGEEIKQVLLQLRQKNREQTQQNYEKNETVATPANQTMVTCPWCGTDTIPNADGKCEYCGGSLN